MMNNKQAATVRLPRETRGNRLLSFARPVVHQGHPTLTNPPYPPTPHPQLNGVIATEAI